MAAPSELQRPTGDRVKTDARDAARLARLLKLDEIVDVTVPSETQEAARDLVRAREDVRGGPDAARHRVSNFPLRQGIVWTGGQAWTGRHDVCAALAALQAARLAAGVRSAYEAMTLTLDRRGRLDAAIVEMAEGCEFTDVVR